MELKAHIGDIVREGNMEEGGFRIEASNTAFDILFDNLYSDKVKAVVREIVCNAMDVTTDRVADVLLPTPLNPVFRCRDYGTGLSHEDVMLMYTTVFKSTKSGSNTKIGGFGLGSKAPFAYVDGFQVSSFFSEHGVTTKRVYSLYRDEAGSPKCALMHTEVTNEEPGLEVEVPVTPSDCVSFSSSIQYVLKHVPKDQRPKLSGAKVELVEPRYLKRWDKFALNEERAWGFRGFSYYNNAFPRAPHTHGSAELTPSCVVMGNIEYPLTISDEFFQEISKSNKIDADIASKLSSYGVTFFFPVGAVSLAPSREALSYNKDTIAVIISAFEELYDACEKDIMDTIEGFDNMWDASIAVRTLKAQVPAYSVLSTEFVFKTGALLHTDRTRLHHSNALWIGVDCNSGGRYTTHSSSLDWYFSKVSKRTNEALHWVWLDPAGTEDRVRAFLRSLKDDNNVAVLFTTKSKQEAETYLDSIGVPTTRLKLASDLPVPILTRTKKTDVVQKPDVEVYDHKKASWSSPKNFDFSKGGNYVVVRHGKAVFSRQPDGRLSTRSMSDVAELQRTLGLSRSEVFCVRIAKKDKFEKANNWHNLVDLATEKLLVTETPEFKQKVYLTNHTSYELQTLYSQLMKTPTIMSSTLLAILDQESKTTDASKEVENVLRLAKIMGVRNDFALSQQEVKRALTYKSLTDKHPMLGMVNPYNLGSKEILNYIVLMDELNT